MSRIYSLQCRVVDAEEKPIPQKTFRIYLENELIVQKRTDENGYAIDNSIKNKHINKEKEKYKVEVEGFSTCKTIPCHILQEEDAQITKDRDDNEVIKFPLKIII